MFYWGISKVGEPVSLCESEPGRNGPPLWTVEVSLTPVLCKRQVQL